MPRGHRGPLIRYAAMRALLASVFLLGWTAIATAQGANQGAALFEEGRALLGQGKYAEACAKFEQSLALDPAIGTQLNLGECHEKQNHNATAWRIFDAAADAEKITNPDRAKFSRGRADALLAKLGVIVLNLTTPDAPMLAVSIGGRTVKPAPVIKEIVDPGDVVINVTARGAAPFSKTEKVSAGKTVKIVVPALEGNANSNVTVPDDPPRTSDDAGSKRRSRLILSYAVGGAGAVALVTGIVLGVKARGDYNAEFDNNNCDKGTGECNDVGFAAQNDAISLANVGTVAGIAGIVLVGAGAALYFTAPKAETVAVTPTATATSAGIALVGRF